MIGSSAPDFSLPDHNGNLVRLSSFTGQKVVLFFYPQDDTPACTKEVCSLRDGFPELSALNAVLIGISPDNAASHRAFREKYHLPFMLLSDPSHGVMEQWAAWGEKKLYGKSVIGVRRSTFVINEQGIIIAAIKRVLTISHAAQVIKHLV